MTRGRVYTLGSVHPHEYVEVYQRKCAGCDATIAMAMDHNERWHPFDPDTGVSHYSTCPEAARFRRDKEVPMRSLHLSREWYSSCDDPRIPTPICGSKDSVATLKRGRGDGLVPPAAWGGPAHCRACFTILMSDPEAAE